MHSLYQFNRGKSKEFDMFTKDDIGIFKSCSSDYRPALECVQFKRIEKDNQWYIRLCATDSYTLVERMVPVEDRPGFEEVLIHRDDMATLYKLMGRSDRAVFDGKRFIVHDSKDEYKTEKNIQVFDATFPKYEQIMEETDKKEIQASTILNGDYLKRIADMTADVPARSLHVDTRGRLDPVIITASNGRTEIKALIMPLKD